MTTSVSRTRARSLRRRLTSGSILDPLAAAGAAKPVHQASAKAS
jgi:hypothetical protein